MFVFFALFLSIVFSLVSLYYIKTYQLEGYKIKNYIAKAIKFDFAFGSKNKLVFTKRAKRLIFCSFLCKFLLFLPVFCFINNFFLLFFVLVLLFVFDCFVCVLSFLIVLPLENCIKLSYIKKAKEKLCSCNCKTIAITGSFGKTSTKHFLSQILSEKFRVCSSPKSFNTPMGICKTIRENLSCEDEFLILEYGARRLGDIEYLSKHFGGDISIITPIGSCHLQTFGSVENIVKEKSSLCKYTKKFVVFNGSVGHNKTLFQKHEGEKYLTCDPDGFCSFEILSTSADGTEFVLCLDKKKTNCFCRLIGQSHLQNITTAAACAYLLGMNLMQIKNAIENLKQVPHRLEVSKNENCTIIDDSFNSNQQGFLSALDILKNFEGRKIVVSPGVIELGQEQFDTNKFLAKETAGVSDVFVIMNQTNKRALSEGAVLGGMKSNQIYFANTREQQKDILQKIVKTGDCVLFENDLPDNIK